MSKGHIARKGMFSLSRWSRSRYTSDGLFALAFAYCHLVPPQAFTGAVPFDDITTEMALLAIMSGKRPRRPSHSSFTDELWTSTQNCWNQDPDSRPEVSKVLEVLGGL